MSEKETKKLYNGITGIDDDIIEGAQNSKPHKKVKSPVWIKWASMAACLAVAVAAAFSILPDYLNQQAATPPKGPIHNTHSSTNTPDITTPDTAAPAGAPAESDLLYSALTDTSDAVDPDIMNQDAAGSNSLKEFDETMLSNCSSIIEGKVTNIYQKHYSFTTSEDKFDNGGTLTYNISSVVYELQVTKVWYGAAEIGSIVMIEDDMFFPDEMLSIKVGHNYVIPIYEAGNEICSYMYNRSELISGDIERDSIYSTIYPYHPQIEVTPSGYIVSTDWKTLTSGESTNIVMDVELGEIGIYFKDKMRLVPAESFSNQMELLIENIL